MANDSTTAALPRVAMALGDPAGIGPELVAKLLACRRGQSRSEGAGAT